MMLAIGLLYTAFIMLKYIPFILSFLRAYIMKWCWIFLHLLRWSSGFLSLHLLICCFTINYLYMLNHSSIPRNKPTSLWYKIFYICCWIQFANILLKIFESMLIEEIGL
jgi:hypothetical protein